MKKEDLYKELETLNKDLPEEYQLEIEDLNPVLGDLGHILDNVDDLRNYVEELETQIKKGFESVLAKLEKLEKGN